MSTLDLGVIGGGFMDVLVAGAKDSRQCYLHNSTILEPQAGLILSGVSLLRSWEEGLWHAS